MSEQEKTCATCANTDCRVPTLTRSGCNAWIPKPAPAEPAQPESALPTLAELDKEIGDCCPDVPCAGFLKRLRPLVEEAECKRAIVAAECWWICNAPSPDGGEASIEVYGPVSRQTGLNQSEKCTTWPEARDWAQARAREREAHAVKAEEWSDPVSSLGMSVLRGIALKVGLDPARVHDWTVLANQLRGYAKARGIYRFDDCIRLGDGPMPGCGDQ